MIEANIKLEFADRRQLQRMIDLLWKIDCPMKDAKCIGCLYNESCLKFREIGKRLEVADYIESKHSS